MNGLLAIASILDPRNKLHCVDFYFKEIYKGLASYEIERVTTLLYDLLVEYQDRKLEVTNIEDPISTTVGTPSSDRSLSQKKACEEDSRDRYAAHKKTKKRKVNLRSELDHYLEEDVIPDIAHLIYWNIGKMISSIQR